MTSNYEFDAERFCRNNQGRLSLPDGSDPMERIAEELQKQKRQPAQAADVFGHGQIMAIAAVRYCLGRQSYIVSDCVDWLEQVWTILTLETREIIKRDIEEAFVVDERARAEGAGYKPLGMDCDRAQWERARRLWV